MFKSIKRNKKWIVLTILLTLTLFALRFPWDKTMRKAADSILKTLPLSSDPEKAKALFFPPGIVFYACSFDGPSFLSQIKIDELRLYPAFSKLLALNPGVRALLKKENSLIAFTVWLKNKKKEDLEVKEIHLKGYSPGLNLSLINAPTLKMFGETRFRFEFMSPRKNLRKAKGIANITGSRVEIKDSLIPTNLGNITLPDLKWNEVSLKMQLKDQELVIERLQLGTARDSFFVQLRGNVKLRFMKNRFRLSYYDFQTQIEVDKTLQSSLITTLDNFLFDTKTSIQKGTRYLARIRGKGHELPDIEKLSSFLVRPP